MKYGIIIGISILIGSIFGWFWGGLVVGLLIALLVFLWPKVRGYAHLPAGIDWKKVGKGTWAVATFLWKHGFLILLVIIAWYIYQRSGWTLNPPVWPVVKQASCKPVWNPQGGWCEIAEVPKGTYRVIAKYDTWQMKVAPAKPGDPEYYPVPPKGVPFSVYRPGERFEQMMRDGAPVNNHSLGGLVLKTGPGIVLDAFDGNSPREFAMEEPSKVFVNINVLPHPDHYQGHKGELRVELQKRPD